MKLAVISLELVAFRSCLSVILGSRAVGHLHWIRRRLDSRAQGALLRRRRGRASHDAPAYERKFEEVPAKKHATASRNARPRTRCTTITDADACPRIGDTRPRVTPSTRPRR